MGQAADTRMTTNLSCESQRMHLKKQEIEVVLYRGAAKIGWEPDPVRLSALLAQLARNDAVHRIVVNAPEPGDALARSGVAPWRGSAIEWVGEDICAGNATRLRSILNLCREGVAVALPMDMVACPPVDELVRLHVDAGACLTVFESSAQGSVGVHSAVFVLDGSLVEFIPEYGYWDIEENLIPELLVLGKDVHQVVIETPLTRVSGDMGEQERTATLQELMVSSSDQLHVTRSDDQAVIWSTEGSQISESSRVYGTVVLAAGVSVAPETVLIGPAILMNGVHIGEGSVVLPGVVNDSVADYTVWGGDMKNPGNCKRRRYHPAPNEGAPAEWLLHRGWMAACALLVGACIWSYMPVIRGMWAIWMQSDEYSSGLLVPFLALYVLWTRRNQLANVTIQPALIWGGSALLMALTARFMGLYYMYLSAERLSMVMAIWALVLWLAGKKLLMHTAGVLLFLLLMVPLPNRVQTAITLPLQKWSTTSAVFCLELCGYPVLSEGNIIQIGDTRVAVAEACNGLRMITAFFVIGALVALLTKRSWWEKVIILASCMPIALICNTFRLAVTAIAFTWLSGERWEQLFHDFGGYAMMPLALALVILQLYLLQRLFVSDTIIEKSVVMRTAGPRGL